MHGEVHPLACVYPGDMTEEPATTPRPRSRAQLLVKELSAFGSVGAVCFLIDIGLFQLLYAHVGAGAVTAKLGSTLVSTTAAYIGHRYWSFSHRARTGVRREYTLFAVINTVTLLLGLAIVAGVRYGLDQDGALVLQVANIGSIVVGTLVRYLTYRQWVFPAHETPAPAAQLLPEEPQQPVRPGNRRPRRLLADERG
jgi:putative flippase GtrA